MVKKILFGTLVVAFIIIQFFHPVNNVSKGQQPNYIGNKYNVPEDIQGILKIACNDCHSNNTKYPWYGKIQPVHWWINKHIVDGKKHLNFDEFINRTARYQYKKLEETIELVKSNEMPLTSYTWVHRKAKLYYVQRTRLTDWAQSVMDRMKAIYPVDSLISPEKK